MLFLQFVYKGLLRHSIPVWCARGTLGKLFNETYVYMQTIQR